MLLFLYEKNNILYFLLTAAAFFAINKSNATQTLCGIAIKKRWNYANVSEKTWHSGSVPVRPAIRVQPHIIRGYHQAGECSPLWHGHMFLFLQYQPRYAVSDRGGEHSLTVSQGVCRRHSHPKGHVSEAGGAVAFSACNYTLICALHTSNFLSAGSGCSIGWE